MLPTTPSHLFLRAACLNDINGLGPHRARSLTKVCGKAELYFVVGFLCFNTLFQNVAIILPEFHQRSPEFHQMFTRIHQMFARISNWSTLKKGISTTRPSHTKVRLFRPSCRRRGVAVARQLPGTAAPRRRPERVRPLRVRRIWYSACSSLTLSRVPYSPKAA